MQGRTLQYYCGVGPCNISMLDINKIRENPEKVKEACEKKNFNCDIRAFLDIDRKKLDLMFKIENLRAKQKTLGKEQIEEAKKIKEEIKSLELEFNPIREQWIVMRQKFPNIPFDDAPVGKDDSENVVLRKVGKLPEFNFTPREHFQIAEELGLIDIERASKVAGSRFYFLKNQAVILEFALINFAFEKLLEKGFIPIIPPVMILPELASLIGYIEDHPDQESYYIERDKLYLTATSEQSLGAMHQDETFNEKELPKKYVAFSTCFRREAGSYGKDTKGIFRVHQFDKIEMFVFCNPEESEKEHKNLLAIEEELIKALQIPYQVVNICTGDLGKPAAKKYDIESWMPGQQRYRETHSTSNCTDYQARGLEIRYTNKRGELNFVHTLNGTAFAIGRTLITILENYQQKAGSVKVPKALQKYAGFKVIKSKR